VTIRLTSVTRTQAAFTNAVLSALSPIPLAVAGRSGTLLWDPRPRPLQPVAALDLTLDGMPALLLLDSDPVQTLVNLPLTAADLASLPPSYQASLIAQAVDDVIDLVTSQTGLSLDAGAFLTTKQIAQAPLLADPRSVELGWRIVGENRQPWLRGQLRLSSNLAARVMDLNVAPARAGNGLAVDELPIPARVELGVTRLTTGELGALEPGDVVLIERHHWDQSLVTIHVSSNLRYAARIDGGDVTVLAREETMPLSDPADTKPSDDASEPSDDATTPSGGDATELSGAAADSTDDATESPDDANEPSDDEDEPSDDESESSDDESEASDDEREPSDDASEPSDDEREPSDDATEPSDDATGPSSEAAEPSDHTGASADTPERFDDTADEAVSNIEQVTIALTFDLGRLELAVGELRNLKEGYVLNLQRPLDSAVTLRVSGKVVGRGELVDLEGSLGVRLVEIFAKSHG
jgi:type III secretion system YscQ/HrcQ family protein